MIAKRFLGALGAVLVLGVAASTAEAGTIVLNNDTSTVHFRTNSGGGEFKVTGFTGLAVPEMGAGVNDFTGHGAFQTFCVEKTQYMYFNKTYQWDLNTKSVDTDIPLSYATAYLYTQFWNGTLGEVTPFDTSDDYVYDTSTTARATAAQDLQQVIWYLQGGQVSLQNSRQTAWKNEALAAVADDTIWGQTIGNVRIMNLYTVTNGVRTEAQDQLVMVPLPPAGLAGLGLLGGLGLLRLRRRRRRS